MNLLQKKKYKYNRTNILLKATYKKLHIFIMMSIYIFYSTTSHIMAPSFGIEKTLILHLMTTIAFYY